MSFRASVPSARNGHPGTNRRSIEPSSAVTQVRLVAQQVQLVAQMFTSSNPLISWMRLLDALRVAYRMRGDGRAALLLPKSNHGVGHPGAPRGKKGCDSPDG